MSQAFNRFYKLMQQAQSMAALQGISLLSALGMMPNYVSRGHGGASPTMPGNTGIAAAKRAATKRRNQRRNKAAHRG